jgi:3-deoxy-D-manno-octulosonate 8-phosphate phosphatase (KDO 8-P phosphatase)
MKPTKILVLDIDGTLTDGKIYIGEQGEIMKAFDIKDGYAIYKLLPKHRIKPVIITGRTSKIVENRCLELGISEIHQGCLDKGEKLKEIALNNGLVLTDYGKIQGCAYIGDDLIDLPGMLLSEIVGCPSDAAEEVRNVSNYICKKKGGNGAVREFIEWLINYWNE